MPDPSAGEVGGIFAGVIALLIAVGHGIRWLIGWEERRDRTRSAKLDAWQAELTAREAKIETNQAEYQASIERKLAELVKQTDQLRAEHSALRNAYLLIASALRAVDDNNPALRLADELLHAAFLLNPVTPPDMEATILRARRPDQTD